MHLDLVAAAGEDRRAAAGTEEPPAVFVRFAVDRHRILGKHRRGVEQRAVMLAAVEAVTDADPVRRSRRHDPDVAAKAATGESVHAWSPPEHRPGGTLTTNRTTCKNKHQSQA